MSALYFEIKKQIKNYEQWMYMLIGRKETLSNLTSYLLRNNSAQKKYRGELEKIVFDLNEITSVFNNYKGGFG